MSERSHHRDKGLSHMTIARKISFILLIPLLGMLYFSCAQVYNLYRGWDNMEKARIQTALATYVSALIHEIQKERAVSTIFVGSRGAKFKEELPKQRQLTEQKSEALKIYLQDNASELLEVRENLDTAKAELERLIEIRKKIDNFGITAKDSSQFFAGLIARQLEIIANISKVSEQAQLSKDAIGYFAFLNYKEKTGQERAALNEVLSAGHFTNETSQRLTGVLSSQQDFFYVFSRVARPDALAFAGEVAKRPIFAEVEKLRTTIFSEPKEGPFSVAPEIWSTAITQKINELKEVEDRIAAEILNGAIQASSAARTNLIFNVLVCLVLLAAAGFLGTKLARSITRQLGCEPSDVANIARQISAGTLDLDIQKKERLEGAYADIISMVDALKEKGRVLDRIKDGDLTTTVVLASENDQLGQALAEMSHSLNTVLSTVNDAIEQISSGSGHVASASVALAQGATQQASSLEEISASIMTISNQSRENAESVVVAQDIAKQTAQGAKDGNDQMQELTKQLANMIRSSEATKKIVKTIDDIAFQVNLLALNASVEAARAGKYGRGFAVVAEEVRSLAIRSAEAVQETTAMVESNLKSISEVNETALKTGTQLTGIMGSVVKVAEVLTEMAARSQEQATAMSQITKSLALIDQVTQANTARSEESAAAAEQMSGQTKDLRTMVSRFTLKKDPSGRSKDFRQLS